jgi:Polyketide cyclase / dehydrase and lipid transport
VPRVGEYSPNLRGALSGSRRHALFCAALRPARLLLCLAPILACVAAPASAASIEHLAVTEAHGRYSIHLRVRLDVPAASAYAVFADLDELRAVNSDVLRARVVGRGPSGSVDLYSEIRACVLWYCRSLRETQRMTFDRRRDGGEVTATVLPQGGDFREGRAHWTFRAAGSRTILAMTADLEPAFRVPPLIGPWLVERWLRREAGRTAANLERLAAGPPVAGGTPASASGDRRAR